MKIFDNLLIIVGKTGLDYTFFHSNKNSAIFTTQAKIERGVVGRPDSITQAGEFS